MTAPNQTGPIAVYGATGFTGKLVARELRRREADFVIAGRNREKLDALSGELGGVPAVAASVDDAAALRSLLEPCAAVIACAGPFTLHGEPVVA
ncbi:MAG: NAD(P)H-binding protein, partial [Solirubrobacterales bacterium]